MTDFLSKLNENKEINESLFDKVFDKIISEKHMGFGPDVNQTETIPQQNIQEPVQSQKKTELTFERGKIIPYELTNIPVLGKFANPSTFISFYSPEEFQAFKSILYYLNHGYFENDIKNIQRAVKYGEIDGYGPFIYLSSIFNKNKGTWAGIKEVKGGNVFSAPKFEMPKDSKIPYKQTNARPKGQANSEGFAAVDSLRRMEKFVKYFVENLVDEQGNPNKVLRNSIISRLKKLFGTQAIAPKQVAVNPVKTKKPVIEPQSEPQSEPQNEPGITAQDFNTGDEDSNDSAAAKEKLLKALKENLTKQVRDILKDSF